MRRNSRAPHASVGQVGGVVPRRLPTAPHQRTRRRKVERQTNRGRDEHGDRDTQSGPLHDWESNRDDGGYAYGGYPEAGFGPRETRRYGDHGRRGRQRTERGHCSAERPRDYAVKARSTPSRSEEGQVGKQGDRYGITRWS